MKIPSRGYFEFMKSFSDDYWKLLIIALFPNQSDNIFPDIFYKKYLETDKRLREEQLLCDSREQKCYINSEPINLTIKNCCKHSCNLEDVQRFMHAFTNSSNIFVPDVLVQLIGEFANGKNHCEIWYTSIYITDKIDQLQSSCDIVNIDNGDIIYIKPVPVGIYGYPYFQHIQYMYIEHSKDGSKGSLYNISSPDLLWEAMQRVTDVNLPEDYWLPLKNTKYFRKYSQKKNKNIDRYFSRSRIGYWDPVYGEMFVYGKTD